MGIVRPHRSAPVVAKALLAACTCSCHDHPYSALRHIDPWIRLVANRTGHPDQIAIVFVLQIAIACVPRYCNPCCLAIAVCCDLRAGVESFHVVASIVSNRRVNLSNLLTAAITSLCPPTCVPIDVVAPVSLRQSFQSFQSAQRSGSRGAQAIYPWAAVVCFLCVAVFVVDTVFYNCANQNFTRSRSSSKFASSLARDTQRLGHFTKCHARCNPRHGMIVSGIDACSESVRNSHVHIHNASKLSTIN